ncbi:MAG: pilus assembly PilX N-terminal domain-containing protein [Actinomycetota bacterium]
MTADREAGVAMITVLFIGAVLTIVGVTAATLAVNELRAGLDDRKASEALGYAEAGVDRLVLELKRGSFTWGDIREAGCERPSLSLPAGAIGDGSFQAELLVYDPAAIDEASRFPPAACLARPEARFAHTFAITSTGVHPTAKRVVRHVIKIAPLQIAMGISADRVDANGQAGMLNVSVLTPGDITGREKLGFTGLDPFYSLADFYPGESASTPMPAAAHAVGTIYFVGGGKNKQEHPPSLNCTANPRGDLGQSLWDGSGSGGAITAGCSGQVGWPPTSLFTNDDLQRIAPTKSLSDQEYITLREAARTSGLYCFNEGGTAQCVVAGVAQSLSSTIQDGDLAGLPSNFVAYFDFAPGSDPFSVGNTIKWKANVGPCSDSPSLNRSVTLIVRNGSLSMENGSTVTGAVILPEGAFDSSGSFGVHGVVSAKEVRMRGGATFELSDCWVRNMPGALLDVTPLHWSELDR